jgi:hypothetical protein
LLRRCAPRNDERYFFDLMARYRPLNATPSSIGCSAPVLQRQPLSAFWNANDFSILSRCATGRLSRLSGAGFAWPEPKSQQVPVQVEAIGLQTENGASGFSIVMTQ